MQPAEVLEVQLWGEIVGYLAQLKNGAVVFEFESAFKNSGLDISPLEMPLATTAKYSSRETSRTFQGLPGIFADCLPDQFGMQAIDGFFKKNFALEPQQVRVLDRLMYIGNRAIGGLEFKPPTFAGPTQGGDYLNIDELVAAARRTLEGKADEVSQEILRVSASPGGRRAKALVDYSPAAHQLRSGFDVAKEGFIPCILKLDGTSEGDPLNVYGRLEYVYSQLAKKCGITFPKAYLLEGESEEGPVAHFLVERFDRDAQKQKTFHYASLCGLTLRDFRSKHACSYEDYFKLVQSLTSDAEQMEQALRRAIFNIVFRNQDDHTKNFGFIMAPSGAWKLAPAFDLTYVFGIGVSATHQMTFADKDDHFTVDDFVAVGKAFGIKKDNVHEILDQMRKTAKAFVGLAVKSGLETDFAEGIFRRFRSC